MGQIRMTLLGNLTARLPFLKEPESKEYFFALNIESEILTACLWTISDDSLRVDNSASSPYSSDEEITSVTDKLLDQVLGNLPYEPSKILFGVPDSWLVEDDLKEAQLKLLRQLVKELELQPMAYVATSHALAHFLESIEGAPSTTVLVGVEDKHLTVTVVRAGKVDGSKVVLRGENLGEDLEKALLLFTEIEVLPSRILIYGSGNLEKHKSQLLAFPLMSKLSFLHFPKVEILEEEIEIKAIALAGAVELNSNVKYHSVIPITLDRTLSEKGALLNDEKPIPLKEELVESSEGRVSEGFGFRTGDVTEKPEEVMGEESVVVNPQTFPSSKVIEDDFTINQETLPAKSVVSKGLPSILSTLPLPPFARFGGAKYLAIFIFVLVALIGAYLFIPKAVISVYVEPRILEKDSQVTADPKIREVDENSKRIPGEIVEVSVSGNQKGGVTGKKQIGDPAKGTVVIFNKTDDSKTVSKGTTLSGSGGLKFTLDSSVTIASQSAVRGGVSFGKANSTATASEIGADGNIPSGTELTVGSFAKSDVSAESEGNFSGGTSKEVTVVTDADQKKLLAELADSLRKQAQQELQAKLTDGPNSEGKKILEEALSEEVSKKSYSKNINDAASEFTLNMTIKYKGTAYSDTDLRTIVSKLVTTEVPDDFQLDLAETETQADVSKLEADGSLVFLARFRAKLMPKIDSDSLKKQIKGKTPQQVAEILKSNENILGSDIKITPSLPGPLQRLPFMEQNIKIEVGLK